ncbi:hypothetical protein [Sphingomonas sp.]|uniref:hypothetical protein n=1 Tax=Sphingomonas sp. TaxID=28214 RepID=UPI003AFFE09B
MLIVTDLAVLRPDLAYWVPAVTMPTRAGGAPVRRFLIDAVTRRPALRQFPAFASRAECLRWIMIHRAEVEGKAPSGRVAAVRLAEWMLGMDAG